MSKERECEHCGFPIDEYEMVCVTKPDSKDPLIVDKKRSLHICFCSCLDCALPNVWYEYKELTQDPPQKAVCVECGSQDVELRRDCSWDIEKQDWVFDDWYSGSYCSSCERVDAGIEKAKVMP